jgi:hypothetical protein
MYTNSNSTLSKNTFLKVTDYTNDNSIFRNTRLPEEISISKIKEIFVNNLLTSREAIQVLSNLEAIRKAIEIFKQRNE